MRELVIDYRINLFTVFGLSTHAPPISVRITLVPENSNLQWDTSPHADSFKAFNMPEVNDASDEIRGFMDEELQEIRERFGLDATVRVQLKII